VSGVARNQRGGENFSKALVSGALGVSHAFLDSLGNTVAKVLGDGSMDVSGELRGPIGTITDGSGIDWGASNRTIFNTGGGGGTQTVAASSNVTLGGWHILVVSPPSTTATTLVYPAGWTWLGDAADTTLEVGQGHMILLLSNGTSDAGVIAWCGHSAQSLIGLLELDDLSDVDTVTLGPAAAGDVLYHGAGLFQPVALSLLAMAPNANVTAHADVDMVSHAPATGDLWQWNGTHWVPKSQRELLQIAQFRRSGVLTIASSTTPVVIGLATEDFKDSDFTHSTSTNTENVTINTTGLYKIGFSGSPSGSAGTRDVVEFRVQRDPLGAGSFANIPGFRARSYVRVLGASEGSTASLSPELVSLNATDIIRCRMACLDGTTTVSIGTNDFTLTLERVG